MKQQYYKLVSHLPLAGVGLIKTAKEWKRIYGYEMGCLPGANFVFQITPPEVLTLCRWIKNNDIGTGKYEPHNVCSGVWILSNRKGLQIHYNNSDPLEWGNRGFNIGDSAGTQLYTQEGSDIKPKEFLKKYLSI